MGCLEDAICDLSIVINSDPRNIMAYVFRGNCYRDQGLFDKAALDYRSAIERSPREFPLRSRFEAYLREAEAQRLLAGIEREALEARLLVQRSYKLLIKARRLQEAIDGFLKIATQCSGVSLVRCATYNLACGYALWGNTLEALNWLERCVKLGWDDALGMEQDADLASLHGEQRFKETVRVLRT